MAILKKLLPHLTALAVFMLVSALYFAPQYQGQAVRQGDDIQATGMAGGIPQHIEKYGEHPQWAPNNFSGMPGYLIHMNYEGRLLKEISSAFYFLGTPAAYYFVLMAGFYFMLLCFGVNPWLSIAGALAYGLSSYFIIIYEAGHITKLMALAWVAPLIGAVQYAYTRRLWLGAALAGIFASIEISTSHPQITYYFLFVLLGLVIVQGADYRRRKAMPAFAGRTAALLLAALLAVGSNLVQLWYVADYAGDSTRSRSELTAEHAGQEANRSGGLDRDYITAWSYGKAETFNLFIPNLYGGSSAGGFSDDGKLAQALEKYQASSYATSMPAYWGPQPGTSGPVYVGAVVVFLFILGLYWVRGANLWWLAAVTLLSFLLAWGRHFMWLTDLFIDYMPGYNKFRTVSMILVIAEWSMPLLGMLAMKKLWDNDSQFKAWDNTPESQRFTKAFKRAVCTAGGIALFFLLLGGSLFDFSAATDYQMQLPDDVIAAMQAERADLLRADAFRSLLFVLAAAALVWLFFKGKLRRGAFAALLAVLVLCDMIPVDRRYLNGDDFRPRREAKAIQPTKADIDILKDTTLSFRVANFAVSTFNDATTSYFHQSVGGYHAAKLRRYQELIDRYLSQGDMDIYSMLNTRYFIIPDKKGMPEARLNERALGNAWFADTVLLVASADEELEALDGADLSVTAVVDERFADLLSGVPAAAAPDSSASVVLTDWRANRLTYRTSSSRDALAVFSEIYYPKGWTAYIDGKETPHLRADYVLRALAVPAGEHTVEFRYRAPHFAALKGVTLASSLALLLMLAGGIGLAFRKPKEDRPAAGTDADRAKERTTDQPKASHGGTEA